MSQAGILNVGGETPSVVETLTGNTGGAVGADGSHNINVVGTGNISVAGNPGTSTLTISESGSVPSLFTENTGTATPSAGNLNVLGTGSTTTVGSGSTVTVELTGLTNHAVLIGAGTTTITKVGPSATALQVLQSGGSSADPAYSTATYPATTTINQLLYSSSANVVGGLATADNGVLITGTTGIPSILADGTTGQVLTATTGSPPSWENISASGAITTIDGDSGSITPSSGVVTISGGTTGLTTSGSGSTLDVTGTLNVAHGGTGNASQTAYSLVCGGTSTTGAFQAVADVATGSVLVSGGTAALPAFSAYPQISGLGIGASAGSTAGLTFDGTNFIDNYAIGTWTPTVTGNTTAGTTTYIVQDGFYVRIGDIVFISGNIILSAATGTGNLVLGGFPFTIKNQGVYNPAGPIYFAGGASWVWPTGATMLTVLGQAAQSLALVYGSGSAVGGGYLQMANSSVSIAFNLEYQI